MTDFVNKALLIGHGLEKMLVDLVSELEKKGREKEGEKPHKGEGEGEDLSGKERAENKIVQEGVKAVKELIGVLKKGGAGIEGELSGVKETLADKLGVATVNDMEVIKEMAVRALDKAEELEKRLEKLEGKKFTKDE